MIQSAAQSAARARERARMLEAGPLSRSQPADPPAPIRVLIVDDHPVVREGIVAVLSRHEGIKVVGQAADAGSAIRMWESVRPDVSLIDLRTPASDGMALIKAMCRQSPRARVLIFTSLDRDHDVARGLQAGAAGYLLKSATPDELIDGIRRVHAGYRYLAPLVAELLAEWVQGETLTRREQQIVELLGHARTNREMADALGIAEGTVKAHMKSVLAKLGAASRSEALLIAVRRGLVTPKRTL
jgi:DNA-binding NarL/FixJ family response regulator